MKSENCNFVELKDPMIRGQLKCDMKNELKAELLRERDFTLEKAIENCKTAEIAASENQAREKPEAQLNAV